MTPETEERFQRIERSLESMAASGARLSAELTQMKEVVEQHTTQIGELRTHIGELENLVLRFGRVVEEQSHTVDNLIAAQHRTDERLNALINVVERYFSNGRN